MFGDIQDIISAIKETRNISFEDLVRDLASHVGKVDLVEGLIYLEGFGNMEAAVDQIEATISVNRKRPDKVDAFTALYEMKKAAKSIRACLDLVSDEEFMELINEFASEDHELALYTRQAFRRLLDNVPEKKEE